MKKKIVGLFIAAVVAVNFIAPPAAHAGSKTIRLRSVVKSSLSKAEQNSITSGKITRRWAAISCCAAKRAELCCY